MSTLRSIVALVGGFAITAFGHFVLVIIAAVLMDSQAPSFRTVNALLFSAAAAIGGYATASLALYRPFTHVMVLAACLLGMAISNMFKPAADLSWNPVLVAVAAPLCALAAGWLRSRQLSKRMAP